MKVQIYIHALVDRKKVDHINCKTIVTSVNMLIPKRKMNSDNP